VANIKAKKAAPPMTNRTERRRIWKRSADIFERIHWANATIWQRPKTPNAFKKLRNMQINEWTTVYYMLTPICSDVETGWKPTNGICMDKMVPSV
jgi:hypothetical protein